MLNCFSKGVTDRRKHLTQLARILPKPEQLFALPRQRLDIAGDGLGKSLRRNVQEHRTRFHKAETLLRRRTLDDRIKLGRERAVAFAARIERARTTQFNKARNQLEGLGRVLDSISYKSVLERGFALVRGEDGKVRRRAAAVKAGEALTLTFADGEAAATAAGAADAPKPRAKKTPPGQESLF
jgi:exodeoxyribonuclease VII large subunit